MQGLPFKFLLMLHLLATSMLTSALVMNLPARSRQILIRGALSRFSSPHHPSSSTVRLYASSSSSSLKIKNLKALAAELGSSSTSASTSSSDPTTTTTTINGWVRTIRTQKTITFINLNDGSSLSGCQCVILHDDTSTPAVDISALDISTGASLSVTGFLRPSSGGSQSFELVVNSLSLLGSSPPSSYPLAKKRHSLEYLRTIAHLRPRTNTISSVARVRSRLAQGVHEVLGGEEGHHFVQTPIITMSDAEGGGGDV